MNRASTIEATPTLSSSESGTLQTAGWKAPENPANRLNKDMEDELKSEREQKCDGTWSENTCAEMKLETDWL